MSISLRSSDISQVSIYCTEEDPLTKEYVETHLDFDPKFVCRIGKIGDAEAVEFYYNDGQKEVYRRYSKLGPKVR